MVVNLALGGEADEWVGARSEGGRKKERLYYRQEDFGSASFGSLVME